MSNTRKRSSTVSAKNFTPCPNYEGRAVCVDVTDLKLYKSQEFEDQWKFKIVFEVDLINDERAEPFCVWSPPLAETLGAKSNLRKFLKSWFGRDLNEDELKAFNLDNLIGMPAQLIVEQEEKGEKVFANIQFIRPNRGQPLAPSGKYVRESEREGEEAKPASAGGKKDESFHRSAPSGVTKPASKTAPNAAQDDPTGVVVHVGKEKNLELGQLPPEKIVPLIRNWLERDFPKIAKPTANDKRLAVALTWYKAEYEKPADEPGEQDPPSEPGDY